MDTTVEIEATISDMVQAGKGILAADESAPTIAKRFAAIDADQPSSGSCRLTGRPFSCRRHCAAGCGRA